MTTRATDRLRTGCKRYGPGRLPYANRPAIGAGYAGASAALVAAATFAVAVVVLEVVGGSDNVYGFAIFAAVALPLVVPAAFVAGVVSWRAVPATVPGSGVVVGVLGTLLTYVGATVLLTWLMLVAAVVSWNNAGAADTAMAAAVIGWLAFLLTSWITLPVGCLGGVIYDRVGSGPADGR
ncbi:hypothetical protein [Natrarchaeobaculum sulfurireducens]|uniref:Uncharacterized protein n=1 Tax=Natrarchaeobaculum sulfurireducens TaxID=2044521 RepID=A0A346PR72_9EURY|nr:hypothetical protein [Natrarchaeobaculum sulfurireducens]AXR82017.1 hypothetical protein AArcMg_2016 [Natrarchaeobaculum sulfurireducens]